MNKPTDTSSLYRSNEGYRKVKEHYDRTLQELNILSKSHFVETSYGLTHVVACGNESGKPIVLWHGQNANAMSWVHWFPALAPSYHIYAVDVIGGMGKSAPSRPSKNGPTYGLWAAEVLEAIELRQANMMGASQGGWLIGKLGSVAPEMISSAVLMSSAGFSPLSMVQAFRIIPHILFKSVTEAAQATLEMVSAPGVPTDPFFLELFELMIRYFRTEAVVPLLSDGELQSLTAPTYLLVGQFENTMNPYKVLERGLKLLPRIIYAEVVPGVGHSMIHKEPDWVISRVMNFLREYAA